MAPNEPYDSPISAFQSKASRPQSSTMIYSMNMYRGSALSIVSCVMYVTDLREKTR